MSIKARNEGVKITPAPSGTFVARCFSMIQIGTIEETIRGVKKNLNKVRISWELPTEKTIFKEEKGEQPFTVSKEFTLSMNDRANLRKFLEGWRGLPFTEDEAKEFDITKLLGKECLLSIIHVTAKSSGNLYSDISSVSRLPKGMTCPPQVNPNFEFTLEGDELNEEKFNMLPDWIKQKVVTSWEYRMLKEPINTNTPEEATNSSTGDAPPF